MKQTSVRRVVVAAFLVPVLCLFPLEVYLRNSTDFVAGFLSLGLLFAFATVVAGSGLFLLTRKYPGLLVPVLAGLSTFVFLEHSLLVPLARHRPFDGELIQWGQYSSLARLELAAAVGTAALIWFFRGRVRGFYFLSLFLLAFYGLGFLLVVGQNLGSLVRPASLQEASRKYFADFYRLSSRGNVIEIVADHTQGSLVYEVLRSRPEHYSRVFDGFTLFVQAAGRYPGTYPSIPFLMTGRAPDIGFEAAASVPFTHAYVEETLATHSIVNALVRKGFTAYGYQVSLIYCSGDFAACIPGQIFSGLPVSARLSESLFSTALFLMDVSLFRVTPVPVRKYIYNDEQWFLRRSVPARRTISGPLDVLIEKMEIDDRPGSYNYIHHAGGHPPIQFDENCGPVPVREWDHESTRAQVACTLLQLERLVETLKEKVIYDQTMIILAGDHGSQWRSDLMGVRPGKVIPARVISSANPVLFVKPPGSRGELRFSFAPASLGDIPATIAGSFELEEEFPGTSLFELAEEEERERVFLWFLPSPAVFQQEALPETSPYRIRGNLFDQTDWIPPFLGGVEDPPSGLSMDSPDLLRFTQGFSRVGDPQKAARWVEGKLARVYLSAPNGGRVRLAFDSYLAPTIPAQGMTVMLNGTVVGRFGDQELRDRSHHVVNLPADLVLKPVNVVEFFMREAVPTPNDARLLSIVLMRVQLEAF